MKFLSHDGAIYFWEKVKNYVDIGLSGKANNSHGNHVPTTQTANNAKFLRNDNTWQTVTPENIGAAKSSHTHTKSQITDFPTSLPANGGTSATCSGNAATATKWAGKTLWIGSKDSLPSNKDSDTIYFAY